MYYLGLDIGSVSINAVILNENKEIIFELPYTRHFGLVNEKTYNILKSIFDRFSVDKFQGIAITGSNGQIVSKLVGVPYEVETVCIALGSNLIRPGVKSIVSIGGQDAMFLKLSHKNGRFYLADFSINGPCASGTGSFIDQQAERLAISMYGQDFKPDQKHLDKTLQDFISLGLKSKSPAPVACRCTVFTKSDMIHLQNKGEPVENIIAGLHIGNARNFVSTIVGNVEWENPVIFVGGMAANKLQVEALKRYFPELEVPKYFFSIGAIGAALFSMDSPLHNSDFTIERLKRLKKDLLKEVPRTKPLCLKLSTFQESKDIYPPKDLENIKGYLGIDIGSTSTKYAFIDQEGNIISKCYVTTRGKPIEVTQYLLQDLMKKLGDRFEVAGICTTGSGRNVVGDFLDADLIIDEITAHTKGAVSVDPNIDTIFEIGGQDSKYIRLKDGYAIDFDMNKICAAGTGSFLHELANKLGINIVDEFQEIALSSKSPINLTDRCTVFMESDLMAYLQKGAKIEDLIAGLSYAIVHNYLNRVVGKRQIGDKIMFLGGPSLNKAVVAAFENILNKGIITPPNREVMGAYGAALLVKEMIEKEKSYKIKERDLKKLSKQKISYTEKICRADPKCSNECKLKIYNFGGRKSVWGGDCGRYEVTNYHGEPCEDYFKIREDIFLDYLTKYNVEPGKSPLSTNGPVIGMPFGLHFHEWAIFWVTFFTELGFSCYLTQKTNNNIVKEGVESVVTEMCFPVKVYHGHVKELLDKSDFYFLPNIINIPSYEKNEKSMLCPMSAASQYIVKQAFSLDDKRILRPHVYLKDKKEQIANILYKELKEKLKVSYKKIDICIEKAFSIYNEFKQRLYEIGKEVLKNTENKPIWIISGRPYNLYDHRLNLHIGSRLSKRGILALPIDFIDLSNIDLTDFPRMYWAFGSRILRAAKFVCNNNMLFGVHITNFSCGPDSFIEHFYKFIMKNKPYLILEFDEHSGVAGMLTRIEAFDNVIKGYIQKQ